MMRVQVLTITLSMCAAMLLAQSARAQTPESCMVDLIADGGSAETAVDIGDVTVTLNDDATWTVAYATTGDWRIVSTHLHLSCAVDGFPLTQEGNPMVGQFEHATLHDPPVAEVSIIDVFDPGCCPLPTLFAAHAEVVDSSDCRGPRCREETAWGEGPTFPGHNWATYFHCFNCQLDCCDDGIECTADSCDELTGCVHDPQDSACDDGNACTEDSCDPDTGCVNEDITSNCGDGCCDLENGENASTCPDDCIGLNSCQGIDACTRATGMIGDNSCNGDFACQDNFANVGDGSCVSADACRENEGNVRNDSCGADFACCTNDTPRTDDECNAECACADNGCFGLCS